MASPVSPQRYQRRASRWLMAMVVAVGALIFAVWLVGDQAARGVRESEAKARTEQAARDTQARAAQTTALRAGCARAVARDSEAWATNRDLRDFARDAEAARRASGDDAVARRYAGIAARAGFRMRRIRLRLPKREDGTAVTAFCVKLYPDPAKG
jgi:hypothetical protein